MLAKRHVCTKGEIILTLRRFALRYGDRTIEFDFPEEDLVGVLEPRFFPPLPDEEEAVRKALRSPIASPLLRNIVRAGEKVAVVFNDMTRLWVRHHVFMPLLLNELNAGGVRDEDITLVSATGAHRFQTPEEWRKLLGEEAFRRCRVIDHDCRASDLCDLGKTRFGTPIRVNRVVAQADKVVLTGGVVHHFLAGYGGGRKLILPGVAAYESIMANHCLSLNPEGPGLNPLVRAGLMEGNPLNEDMVEFASRVGADFTLNVVLAEGDRFGAVVAGDMTRAHAEGRRIVDRYFNVGIREQADLVIASCGGFPKDINFYQTYKSVHNAIRAVRPGGAVIMLTESRESLGNDLFYRIFADYPDNESRERALRENYEIAAFMGFCEALWSEKYRLIIVSTLPAELIRGMNMIPASSMMHALERAYALLGPHPRTYLMPYASTTFPVLN